MQQKSSGSIQGDFLSDVLDNTHKYLDTHCWKVCPMAQSLRNLFLFLAFFQVSWFWKFYSMYILVFLLLLIYSHKLIVVYRDYLKSENLNQFATHSITNYLTVPDVFHCVVMHLWMMRCEFTNGLTWVTIFIIFCNNSYFFPSSIGFCSCILFVS